jgi:hypothetical protein
MALLLHSAGGTDPVHPANCPMAHWLSNIHPVACEPFLRKLHEKVGIHILFGKSNSMPPNTQYV